MIHMSSNTYKSQLQQLIYEQKFFDKFLTGSGCCLICFNKDPYVLEEHHIGGRNNSELTITVCANHHAKLTRMQKGWNKRWQQKNNPQTVKETFLLRGLSDVFRLKSDYVLELDGNGQ